MSKLTDFCDRIRTVADESFGPFPHQTAAEALNEIEKGIHEYKRAVAVALSVLEVIADPKADLPTDGRETCRIYEDMALEALARINGFNTDGLRTRHLVEGTQHHLVWHEIKEG